MADSPRKDSNLTPGASSSLATPNPDYLGAQGWPGPYRPRRKGYGGYEVSAVLIGSRGTPLPQRAVSGKGLLVPPRKDGPGRYGTRGVGRGRGRSPKPATGPWQETPRDRPLRATGLLRTAALCPEPRSVPYRAGGRSSSRSTGSCRRQVPPLSPRRGPPRRSYLPGRRARRRRPSPGAVARR
jgi:hypothetical protein